MEEIIGDIETGGLTVSGREWMLDEEGLASRIGVVPFPRYGGAVTVTVTRLLESIRRLLDAQSDEEVYQTTVEAADAVISADTCLLGPCLDATLFCSVAEPAHEY